jgi:molybdopterin-guanine dinucleotide biosynthesis protein A
MDHAPAPAIVIAAGGDGRRMGGAKPLRELAGRTLLDHACAWAQRHGGPCALALRDAGQVPPTSLPLLIDAHPGIGPVSALISAMRFARAQGCTAVLLIGCDQPFLPDDLPARLTAAIGDHAVAMPVSSGKDQPLASLWRLHESAVAAFIGEGGRSLWRLADRLGAVRVAWESAGAHPDAFANINDPDSLARLAAAIPETGTTPCA